MENVEPVRLRTKDVMVRDVAVVSPHDSLAHAAALMAARTCGSVVVVNALRRPLAMLTDRDICMAALHVDQPLSQLRVAQAMSKQLFCCHGDDELVRAEDLMALHQVRRLPVLEGDHLAGIVTIDDLARASRQLANRRLLGRRAGDPDFAGTLTRVLSQRARHVEPTDAEG